MYTIIVACDPNGVIGKNNTIPWRLPEDLKLFKQRTIGGTVIMGRKTWDSLPKKPLPGRINVVLSKAPFIPEVSANTCISFKEVMEFHPKGYIIGGAMVYQSALDEGIVSDIIMTKVKKNYDGDVFFPILGKEWLITAKEDYEDFEIVYFYKR